MVAFALVILIFSFWSFLGFAIVSKLHSRRNLLQASLLCPATGLAATVLVVMWLNLVGLPVRYGGAMTTVLLLALAAWLLRGRRLLLPGRRLLPFAALLLLALLVTGYPLLRYGFDWVSYCNEDMANYALGAKYFLNHAQLSVPAPADFVQDRDASQFFWVFLVVDAMRHGAEELLAWLCGCTGLSPHQAYMTLMMALHLVLIASTAALILQGRKQRKAALLVCFMMALSALVTLGTAYQLLGQVTGLSMLAATSAILLRPMRAWGRKEIVYAGILGAGTGMLYPEVLPFLGLPFLLYHGVLLIQRRELLRDVFRNLWPVAAVAAVFQNIILFATGITLMEQASGGSASAIIERILFPYYLTPAGFAYLWGFRAISEQPRGVILDFGIVAGATLFFLVLASALTQAWRRLPVAFIFLVMAALSFQLLRARADFGIFKIAMYMQPFLIGTLAVTWRELFVRFKHLPFARWALLTPLLLTIGFGMRAQVFYSGRSLGSAGGTLVEIPDASSKGLVSHLVALGAQQAASPAPLLADASNVVLAKFESLYHGPIYFMSKDFFPKLRASSARWRNRENLFYWLYGKQAADMQEERGTQFVTADFDMHGAIPMANSFSARREAMQSTDFPLLQTNPKIILVNRRTVPDNDSPVRIVEPANTRNYLMFVHSQFGRAYYQGLEGRSQGWVSMYQPEHDYFFGNSLMSSMGRDAVFRVINPTSGVRLVVEYTATLNGDHSNLVPAASVIGNQRIMLSAEGHGSARLFSAPFEPQTIGGGQYVALDMGTWGQYFPDQRSWIMSRWGTEIRSDSRRIVGFARDISLISDPEYAALHAPAVLSKFPADLRNQDLEYSGFYEDGWVGGSGYAYLQQPEGSSTLTMSLEVPPLGGSRASSWVALLVDGEEVGRTSTTSGYVKLRVPVHGSGRRRVELRFDRAVNLPEPDNRPISALVKYLGFQPGTMNVTSANR